MVGILIGLKVSFTCMSQGSLSIYILFEYGSYMSAGRRRPARGICCAGLCVLRAADAHASAA